MSDVKDILGVPRSAPPGDKPELKEKKEKIKRPEGMSREAFALLGDSHPIISSHLSGGVKKKDIAQKPKPSTKGIPTYQYKGFLNSARGDDLELFHWVKLYKNANGTIKEPEDTEYPFAKFSKKVQLYKYNEEEYDSLIKDDSSNWTKAETDYLIDLCELLDLRWPVILDRYEFPNGPSRTMEDLKERYYSVARRLLVAREGGEAPVANHVLVKYPYNKQHEQDRKKALHVMLTRTAKQLQEENAILAEAGQIEERRRGEANAGTSRRTGAAPATTPRIASPAQPARQGSAAVAGAGGGVAPVVVPRALSPAPALLLSELRHPADFENDPGRGVPSLFDAEVRPARQAPGAYARGQHAQLVAGQMAAAMAGGSRAFKNVETTLADLGWPAALTGPQTSTRAVCGAWLALRSEVIALHELKRNLQNRMNADDRSARRPEKKKKA